MNLVSLVLLSSLAFAAESPLTITSARVFAPMKGTNATAGYGVIANSSSEAVSLTVDKVAPFKAAELHESAEKDGKMTMTKIEKLVVPAKGSVELKPGGNHLMLFDASRTLKEGEEVEAKFLANGKPWTAKFKIVPRVMTDMHMHH